MKSIVGRWLLLLPLLAGCGGLSESDAPGDEPENELSDGTRDQSLIGGVNTTARPEVGLINITTSGVGFNCTATLISARYFITAAHCNGYRPYATGGTFTITRNPVPAPP